MGPGWTWQNSAEYATNIFSWYRTLPFLVDDHAWKSTDLCPGYMRGGGGSTLVQVIIWLHYAERKIKIFQNFVQYEVGKEVIQYPSKKQNKTKRNKTVRPQGKPLIYLFTYTHFKIQFCVQYGQCNVVYNFDSGKV